MDTTLDKQLSGEKHVPIPRRPKFNFTEELRRRWCYETIFYTMLLNAYTIMFPAVERYTVTTLRSVLDDITDPELKARTTAMIAQEAIHAKQHEESLQVLQKTCIEHSLVERFNRFVMSSLAPMARPFGLYGKHMLVAGVAGGEHWTTIVSRESIKSRAFEYSDGPMSDLFLWHATEEIEHKSVAYDVLQHLRPGYITRVLGFAISTFIFFFLNFVTLIFLTGQMRVQEFLHPRFYVEILLFLVWWPGAIWKTLWAMIEYCLPGFHPDKHNDDEVLQYGLAKMKENNLATE